MKRLFKILIAFFAFCFITFAFIMPLNPPVGNWYQQFLPNIGGRQIKDITFTDSLNGFIVTSEVSDSSFILRTTTGGDSWFLSHFDTGVCTYYNIQFINQSTGFVSGYIYDGSTFKIVKTTNGGINWFYINSAFDVVALDMHVLNQDTIWLADAGSLVGGVYRTTNGGASWQNQLNLGSQNPAKIYMYNGRIGFISTGAGLYKTTNSGTNWLMVSGGAFGDMYFIDSLTGWKNNGVATIFQKTIDGGLNWVTYNLPPEQGIIVLSRIKKFDNVFSDTIYGVGSEAFFGAGQFRGLIYRSTNSGQTWGYQLPDTLIHSGNYQHIQFKDKSKGWAYWPSGGVHTTNGGDTTFYLGIVQTSSSIPKNFELKQNYPNPFNPRTVIPYSIKSSAYVKLIAYDILGRENQKLVDQHQSAGEYEVDFIGKFASSGVYFYRIEVTDDNTKQLFTETKKMLLIK